MNLEKEKMLKHSTAEPTTHIIGTYVASYIHIAIFAFTRQSTSKVEALAMD